MESQLESNFNDSLFRSDSGIGLSDFSSDFHIRSQETKKKRKSPLNSFEDPLDEPIVKCCLQKNQITRYQLIDMSIKELNQRLSNCSPIVVSMLKRCRRTLKNRGYARNCRIKRIVTKTKLEEANSILMRENKELKDCNKLLLDQIRGLTPNQSYEFNSPTIFPDKFDNNQQQPHGQRLNGGQGNQSYKVQTYIDNQGGCSTDVAANHLANCTCKIGMADANEGTYAELDYMVGTTIDYT